MVEPTRSARSLINLIDIAPDVVIRFDRQLRIRYVNRIVEVYTALSRDQLMGRTVAELPLPEANIREWEEALREVLATGRPGDMEFTFTTPDGPRYFESRFVPENGANGRTRSILGITRDVTQRRLAEAAARRSEAFLAEGQRISHTGSWSQNYTTGAVVWSDEHYRIFGVDPGAGGPWPTDALVALLRERVHPADRAVVRRTLENAIRESSPLAVNYRIVLPDGSIKHIRSEGLRGTDEDYIGTTVDVTSTWKAEQQLRRSEAYLAEGQRLSHTGSWGWHVPTGEIFWSREMFRIYGFPVAEHAPPYEAVLSRAHADDAPGVHASLHRSLTSGADLRLLTRILIPGEPMKWVQTYGHALYDDDGAVVEFVGTVVDVTARVRSQRRLRRAAKARYEAVLAERTRIARDMHDGLLQDVAGIALQLGAVIAYVQGTPDVAARLDAVLQLAEQTGRNARLALQGMREGAESADLVSAVQHAAQRAVSAALTLTIRVSGRSRLLPPAVCEAAASIVQEAIANVLTHADARMVRIDLAFMRTRLRLSVVDDGHGLLARRKADDDAAHFGLLGMRERAASVHGVFSVSSVPGRGTRVRLDLPYPT